MELDVGASIQLAIGDQIEGSKDEILGALRSRRTVRPIYGERAGSGISDGTKLVTIEIGFPPAGSIWQLDTVSCFSGDDHTIATDTNGATLTGSLYLGNPGSASLTQLAVPGLKFPDFFEFQQGIYVRSNMSVFLQTSLPSDAGQQVGCVIRYREWLEAEISRMSGRG